MHSADPGSLGRKFKMGRSGGYSYHCDDTFFADFFHGHNSIHPQCDKLYSLLHSWALLCIPTYCTLDESGIWWSSFLGTIYIAVMYCLSKE